MSEQSSGEDQSKLEPFHPPQHPDPAHTGGHDEPDWRGMPVHTPGSSPKDILGNPKVEPSDSGPLSRDSQN